MLSKGYTSARLTESCKFCRCKYVCCKGPFHSILFNHVWNSFRPHTSDTHLTSLPTNLKGNGTQKISMQKVVYEVKKWKSKLIRYEELRGTHWQGPNWSPATTYPRYSKVIANLIDKESHHKEICFLFSIEFVINKYIFLTATISINAKVKNTNKRKSKIQVNFVIYFILHEC